MKNERGDERVGRRQAEKEKNPPRGLANDEITLGDGREELERQTRAVESELVEHQVLEAQKRHRNAEKPRGRSLESRTAREPPSDRGPLTRNEEEQSDDSERAEEGR